MFARAAGASPRRRSLADACVANLRTVAAMVVKITADLRSAQCDRAFGSPHTGATSCDADIHRRRDKSRANARMKKVSWKSPLFYFRPREARGRQGAYSLIETVSGRSAIFVIRRIRTQVGHRARSAKGHVWTAPAVQEESDLSANRSGAAMYAACFSRRGLPRRDAAAVAAGPDVIR